MNPDSPILAGSRTELASMKIARLCQTLSTLLLFFYALAAPHSIAGSQGGFLAAATFFIIGHALSRDWSFRRTPLDLPFLGLFLFATLSSAFSYEPYVSIKGLRNLAFFSAFYLVVAKATDRTTVRRLALVLIVSCLANVGLTLYQKAVGQGVKVDVMHKHSHLDRSGIEQGDVLVTADGQMLHSIQDLQEIIQNGSPESRVKFEIRRGEMPLTLELTRKRLQPKQAEEGLGIEVSVARDFRAHGFYNHYATYAEVLQLIASIYYGLLLACPRRKLQLLLGAGAVAVTLALIFTATRAPLLGLVFSALIMVFLEGRGFERIGGRRLIVVALVLIALAAGVYAISKWRGVGMLDRSDGSVAWRLQVWQEGLGLIARDPLLGIGRGSEKLHWREWGLYQHGELPPGHFHSTPLQIAVWWGLPALACLIVLMYRIITTLIKGIYKFPAGRERDKVWWEYGLVLGGLGAVCGFNLSSLVHFNFGDGEVTMALWLVVGLAFAALESQTFLPEVQATK